jgi:RNA-binding protein
MITEKQKKFLRARAHHLKPVVSAGNAGISEGVLREIDLALAHHELIKVRVSGVDRDELKTIATTVCEDMDASLVQLIGHIVIMYRPAKKPQIQLPKL